MTLREAAQQALEALEGELPGWRTPAQENAITALRAALEQPEQTCNCRWVDDVQTQQCTLHEAHVDAIHEWAERAKAAEAKLGQSEQAKIPKEFDDWWDADRLTQTNPFPQDSPVYWAFEGWQARAAIVKVEGET